MASSLATLFDAKMKVSVLSTLLFAAGAIAGRSPQHVNKKLPERMRREPAGDFPAVGLDKRAASKKKKHIIPQNSNTTSTYNQTWIPGRDMAAQMLRQGRVSWSAAHRHTAFGDQGHVQ